MDSTGNPVPERDQEVELNEKTDQVHLAILTTLATLEAKVGHLGEMFAEHREERSKLGERVGDLEKAVPDKLQDRLAKIEIRMGQIAIISAIAGGIVGIAIQLAWGEISKRVDAQPTVIHRTIRP